MHLKITPDSLRAQRSNSAQVCTIFRQPGQSAVLRPVGSGLHAFWESLARTRKEVWSSHYWPHVLDSNAQIDSKGDILRHFTRFFTLHSPEVNVFAQTISAAETAYVFPPFFLVGPLLRFLLESEPCFTIVVPKLYPLPFWWPILISRSHACLQLGSKRDLGILLFPSRNAGFVTRPLSWDFCAFRVASGK